MLAVEKLYRRRPFNKIFTIACMKVWPNSRVSSEESFQVLEWGKKKLFVEVLMEQFSFAEWGGERYDSLKNITRALQTPEVRVVRP